MAQLLVAFAHQDLLFMTTRHSQHARVLGANATQQLPTQGVLLLHISKAMATTRFAVPIGLLVYSLTARPMQCAQETVY
jgi:hypothetical protein